MNFFMKLFKALNSAQKPWQITLAVVLGMLMGLTPLSGIQTFLILFLAFTINIHLGFFFIMAAQFAAIGYLFDPLFDDLGFYLLSLESLEALWTQMYNSGLMRLTYFNNTVVLGSTFASLLLALPLYFLIRKFLLLYRERIAVFCANNRWLNKFGFFDRPEKKEPAIRLWGLGSSLLLFALFALMVTVFLDSWIKIAMEKGLSLALNRGVYIEKVHSSWSEASLDIKRLAIEGSQAKQSAMSIDSIHSDLDFNALLLGKVNIENVAIKGMKFNQSSNVFENIARQERKQEKKEATQKAEKDLSKAQADERSSSISLPSVDEVLKNSQLKSKKSYETADAEIEALSKKWKAKEKELSDDPALTQLEQDFKLLGGALKNLKLKDLKSFKKKTDAFKAKVSLQKRRFRELKSDFNRDKKRIDTLMKNVKKAKERDLASIKSKYTIDRKGGVNVLGAFLGPKIEDHLKTALKLYESIAPYLKSDEKVEVVMDRHKGRVIRFKEYQPKADLHIVKTEIDGSFEGQSFKADIEDISDNQKLINRAMRFRLLSDGMKAKGVNLYGYDDRRGEKVKGYLNLRVKKIPKTAFNLALVALHKSDMALKGELTIVEEKNLLGRVKIDFTNAELSSGKIKGRLGEAITADLANLKKFYATIDVRGDFSNPDLKIRSDLSGHMKKSVDRYVKRQLKDFERKIAYKLEEMTAGQLKTLRMKNQNFSALGGGISQSENRLNLLNKKSGSLDALPKKSLKKIFGF